MFCARLVCSSGKGSLVRTQEGGASVVLSWLLSQDEKNEGMLVNGRQRKETRGQVQ